MPATGWWDRARCASLPPGRVAFFTDDSRVAKSVCRGCPVRIECLAAGLYEPAGVWGGLNRRERSALLRLRAHLRQDATDPDCRKGVQRLRDVGFTTDELMVVCQLDRTTVELVLDQAPQAGGRQ